MSNGRFGIMFIYTVGEECCCFFFQAEDGIRDVAVTGVQTCALPISLHGRAGLEAHPTERNGEGFFLEKAGRGIRHPVQGGARGTRIRANARGCEGGKGRDGRERSGGQRPTTAESRQSGQGGGTAHAGGRASFSTGRTARSRKRSEEHTSELQSRLHLVCRLLLEKKKKTQKNVEIH